ncbi:phosphatidylinositol transfer protein csr1 [Dispira parvispora]|uniref:Phosphatidylinositol transfer protein csr1 n=1 Tax=Dispira parvispora TaxID=1520584 RepID=A0A9W8AYR0_9FUNG|nr:phosphatidylinositol transfer protein csr1 [Dispira parvispora]
MSAETQTNGDKPTGYLGNLTDEQQQKLQALWKLLLQCFDDNALDLASSPDTGDDSNNNGEVASPEESASTNGAGTSPATENPSDQVPDSTTAGSAKPKKSGKSLNFLKLKRSKGSSKSKTGGESTPAEDQTAKDTKPEEAMEKLSLSPDSTTDAPTETLRESFWRVVQADHPDSILLRFLRARKWNVDKALAMILTALRWRIESRVDEVITLGEEGLDLKILEKGISFLHGEDKQGRPVVVTRVKMHRKDDQTVEEMTRYLIWTIETLRMFLAPGMETVTIIFDLSDFTMANMDFNFVKILIRCLEAYYPESLGALLIYNAPWIFSGVWRMISPLLDPVVASKINFIDQKQQFENFIDPTQLVDWLGGQSSFRYEYQKPTPEENKLMKNVEERDRRLAQYTALTNQLEEVTRSWAELGAPLDDNESAKQELADLQSKRMALAEELRQVVRDMDPYIRARTLYHRMGVLQAHGSSTWDHIVGSKDDEQKE